MPHLMQKRWNEYAAAKCNEKLKKTRIWKAIETRLAVAPQQYGEPLRKTLKGY